MSKFSKRTEYNPGTVPPLVWMQNNFVQHPFEGKEEVEILEQDNKITKVPISEACLVFVDLVEEIKENKSNVRGTAPQVTGVPLLHLFRYTDAFKHLYKQDNFVHPGIEMKQTSTTAMGHIGALLPLGRPMDDWNRHVVQESARRYISAGRCNIDMSDQHVGNMLISMIKTLIWTCVNDHKIEDQITRFQHLTLLCKSARWYFSRYPESYRVIEPLKDDIDTMDVLVRASSFIFFTQKWSTEELVRILELMLKRYRKKFNHEISFVSHPITGCIACLLTIPYLREMIAERITAEEASNMFNQSLLDLVQTIASIIEEDTVTVNKKILRKIISMSDLKTLTEEQVDKIYEYTMDRRNMVQLAPLEEWGVIEKVEMKFILLTDDMKITGKPLKTKVLIRNGEEGYQVFSTSATDWSCIGLITPGIYIFKPKLIGVAAAGRGNTVGQVNVANLRFTTGLDVLPRQIEGRASTGKHYYNRGNRWDYYDTNLTLDLTRSFEVKINQDRTFEIKQNGPFFAGLTEPNLLIGFKFLKFELEYNEIQKEEVKIESIGVDNSIKGLTGQALIAKLAELKIDESKKKREQKKAELEVKEQEKICSVCMAHPYNCTLNCGHCTTCTSCASKLNECPICRKEITTRTKTFFG